MDPTETDRPLGQGLGTFLIESAKLPPLEEYIEGLLSSEGSGWIGGEKKLGKSYYILHEALCLVLARPVLGRFRVPMRRRVLMIEEEDPPRRVRDRLRALLRGFNIDPDDPAVLADLDPWFHVEVWSGFTVDDAAQRGRLDQAVRNFQPDVVYLDAVRKVTSLNLSKGDEAQTFLGYLDAWRRTYGVLFRVIHHYRKVGGGGASRSGRGSQEIAGSNKLGAWGEDSLFFEPIGRRDTVEVGVTAQRKDHVPPRPFRIGIESEGDRTILTTKDDTGGSSPMNDTVHHLIATLPPAPATKNGGRPGVSVAALIDKLGKPAESAIRRSLKALEADRRVVVTGHAEKDAKLYGVNDQ